MKRHPENIIGCLLRFTNAHVAENLNRMSMALFCDTKTVVNMLWCTNIYMYIGHNHVMLIQTNELVQTDIMSFNKIIVLLPLLIL